MLSSQEIDDVEALIKEGSSQISKQNIKKAIKKYQEAYDIAEKSGKPDVLVSCACNLGAALISQGDSDQAIKCLTRALKDTESDKNQTDNLFGDVHFNLGLAYSMKDDHSSAVRHFKIAADVFHGCSDFKGLADSWQQLGEQHVKLAQPLKASECYKKASDGYLDAHYVFLAAKMRVREALSLYNGGNMEESLSVLLNFRKLYSQIPDRNTETGKLVKLLYDVGSLLNQLRSPEHAASWLEQALVIVRTLRSSGSGNDKVEARILLTLGEVCIALSDYTNAVTINKEASAIFGRLDNKKARGQCFYQLAEAYRHLGDHHNAEKYYHIAYQTLEDAGLQSSLWQVFEGLADLNYQRRQLDTSISYYKESLSQLKQRGAHHTVHKQIVSKLATALEIQRAGVVKAVSYKNREPVLIHQNQDEQQEQSMSFQSGLPDISLVHSPTYAPLTSTRLSLYAANVEQQFNLDVPGKKKKKHHGRHGRRRSGSFDKPVSKGVGEYDTETDISIVNGKRAKMSRRVKTPRPKSIQRRSGTGLQNSKVLQGLDVEEEGAAPLTSSVDDSTQMDQSSPGSYKGLNMSTFSDDDDLTPRRGRSASQTCVPSVVSSSEESDSFTEISSDDDLSGSSEDYSMEDSHQELRFLDQNPGSRMGNTYEHPSTDEPLYASIKSKQSSVGQHEEKLYETLNSTASTAVLTSSMPHRTAPLPPSPPEPPRAPRPSQKVTLPPDEEEPRPGVSSWSGTHYPESTVLKGMSRGQREMGLYQVAQLAQEREVNQSCRSSMSSVTSDAKVPKSKACIVM
ncbi:uncharacterized protein LOC117295314 [Asterias rubens]|uniref:uncharacterized protein LOC117295314 n=1 Tax=Asterias rubens TaxID=7604 RepID=UPI0014555BD1|nr:uncharacterized protein LOC117295314 [Asterias rubens]XP_033633776.1 uncharacterized protein LOC117295314 [Asterias rubens]XP_033633777.1 uncharacterized protein LOC117295314 [Asterias rubens]